ncbi:MAG TPA: hypothetical protein VFU59_01665, partial [Candidatus Eisenbacteria bacterium]|nr:hypothetical protein [Candidatus Eisenbacteria bacterium]
TSTKELSTAEKTASSPPPPPRVAHDDEEMWPVDDPVVKPAPATPKPTAPAKPSVTAGATDAHAAPPASSGAPVTGAAPESAAPAAPTGEMKTIDRLHAATEQAMKEQDLDALRKLKVTWKNLARTVIGPDRSRTKREFAECLWDIQTLTGRDADQREALAAYRDFLLSAPAGGADARSAARLRELEDALAERR